MTDSPPPIEPVLPLVDRIERLLTRQYPEIGPLLQKLNAPKGRLGIAVVLLALVAAGGYASYTANVAQDMRYDIGRVSDLQQIKLAIQDYYNENAKLPDSLKGLEERSNPAYVRDGYLFDSETRRIYEYRQMDPASYQLCASFHYSTDSIQKAIPRDTDNTLWDHDPGHHCFQVTVKAAAPKLKLLDQ